MKEFSVAKVMVDLKEQGVVLGKCKKNEVAEECRFVYKEIDQGLYDRIKQVHRGRICIGR